MKASLAETFMATYYAIRLCGRPRPERLDRYVTEVEDFVQEGRRTSVSSRFVAFGWLWVQRFGADMIDAPEAHMFARRLLIDLDNGALAEAPADGISLAEAFDAMTVGPAWGRILQTVRQRIKVLNPDWNLEQFIERMDGDDLIKEMLWQKIVAYMKPEFHMPGADIWESYHVASAVRRRETGGSARPLGAWGRNGPIPPSDTPPARPCR